MLDPQGESSGPSDLQYAMGNGDLAAIFASLPVAILVLDAAYTIRQANPAVFQMLGMAPDRVVGQHVSDVITSAPLLNTLQRLSNGELIAGELELTITEPTRRVLLIGLAPLSPRGWIVVMQDQTRHRQRESEKSELVRVASYELRTPLTAVMGYAQLLQARFNSGTSQADDTERRYLEMIATNSALLKDVVDELVDVTGSVDAANEDQGIREFSVPDLVREVVAELLPAAQERQVDVQFGILDQEARMVADPALVTASLQQLLLNAINFNVPHGSVKIDVGLDDETILICIQDTGVGISRAKLDSTFNPYFNSEAKHDTHTDGMGLGLSIVRWAVKQLKGVLSYESSEDSGTTVMLTLPTQQTTSEAEIATLRSRLEASRHQAMVYASDSLRLYRELRQVNTQLREANTQLEEANRLKSNFLGTISHELRSPLVPMDLALQAIPRYGLDHLAPEQRELLDQLNNNLKLLRQMIDNLVAYAGLLSKQGRLQLEEVNISAVIQEAVSAIAPMALHRKLSLEAQVPDGLILPAGDVKHIGEAIWHLLHNAIKFTQPGGDIVVEAHAEPEQLVISVKDTGIGIPAEQQSRIFESFSQLTDPLKRGMEGLGLGLAYVRYVALAHGGDVILRSQPGVGSVIGFSIPLRSSSSYQDV